MSPQADFHYEIKDEIGKGYMGIVYRAWDTTNHRVVAIKRLPSKFTGDEKALQRFQQEARIATNLNHPNIVTIHEIGEADSSHFPDIDKDIPQRVYFIATEFIEGQNLRQRMDESLELVETLNIAIGVAEALEAAHTKGIMHRDVKPENIMIRPDGHVKLLDFGLAKLTRWFIEQEISDPREANTLGLNLTSKGFMPGTPCYMSPEQCGELPQDRLKEVDQRTDIWGLGVVLYEMTTGNRPFDGRPEILPYLIKKKPTDLRPFERYGKRIRRPLVKVVQKALSKDRGDRYESVAEMRAKLIKVRHEVEFADDRKRSRNLAVAVLIVLICALIGIAFWPRNPPKPPPPSEPPARSTDLSNAKSIAVLPFAPIEPGDKKLGEGIANTLVTRLSNLNQIPVYRGNEQDLAKANAANDDSTRELVLTGTIQRSGRKSDAKIRVSVNIQRGKGVVWSKNFDEKFDERSMDLLALQDSICEHVVSELKVEFTADQKSLLSKRYTENDAAYRLYLKGRDSWNGRTQEGFEQAIDYFNQAIGKDPKYALAYAGLADCHSLLGFFSYLRPDEAYRKAKEAATKALELDPDLAEAHASLGYISAFYDGKWAEAEVDFKMAIRLKANYATAHHWYALLLARTDRHEEADVEIRRALDLDPHSLIINRSVGLLYYYARQYDPAIAQYQKTLDIDNSFVTTHIYLAKAYIQKKMFQEARSELDSALALLANEPNIKPALGLVYAAEGKRAEALQIIAELETQSTNRYVSPFAIAEIYATLGDNNRTIKWLDQAIAEHSDKLMLLNVEPTFDNVRSDPRFKQRIQRLKSVQ